MKNLKFKVSIVIAAITLIVSNFVLGQVVQNGVANIGTYYVKLYSATDYAPHRLSFRLLSASSSEYSTDVDIFIPTYVFYNAPNYGIATSGVGPQVTIRTGGLTAQSATFKKIHVVSNFIDVASDVEIWLEFYADVTGRIISLTPYTGSEPITWEGLTTTLPSNIKYSVDFIQGGKNENGNLQVNGETVVPNNNWLRFKKADGYNEGILQLNSANQMILRDAGSDMLFQLWDGDSWETRMFIEQSNGNVGIGTIPGKLLDVAGVIRGQALSGFGDVLEIGNDTKLRDINYVNTVGLWGLQDPTVAELRFGSNEKTVITSIANANSYFNNGGNVGIGTTNVTHKLTVKGKILAEEVQVVLAVPDYVFAKEYKLKTLSEVSKFINEHKHLPEVPSEKEVMDNDGQVSLGEMNMTLLKKIEELTLYAIEQENNSQKQDEVIKELLKRVTELEKL